MGPPVLQLKSEGRNPKAKHFVRASAFGFLSGFGFGERETYHCSRLDPILAFWCGRNLCNIKVRRRILWVSRYGPSVVTGAKKEGSPPGGGLAIQNIPTYLAERGAPSRRRIR